jgi:hypothetical protein
MPPKIAPTRLYPRSINMRAARALDSSLGQAQMVMISLSLGNS